MCMLTEILVRWPPKSGKVIMDPPRLRSCCERESPSNRETFKGLAQSMNKRGNTNSIRQLVHQTYEKIERCRITEEVGGCINEDRSDFANEKRPCIFLEWHAIPE